MAPDCRVSLTLFEARCDRSLEVQTTSSLGGDGGGGNSIAFLSILFGMKRRHAREGKCSAAHFKISQAKALINPGSHFNDELILDVQQ